MEPRPPERLVGVDVADAGQEVLVQQQRLEPAAPPRESISAKRAAVKSSASGSAPLRQHARRPRPRPAARGLVAPVQPDPPELAHVAEPQLTAVGQRQNEMDVAILRSAGRDDEELAGHLEMDGQDGRFGQPPGLHRSIARPIARPASQAPARARRAAACPVARRPRSRGPPLPRRKHPARGCAASAASSSRRRLSAHP